MTDSGVFSSCETLATNSCRSRSRRRSSVVSCSTSTAPRGGSARAAGGVDGQARDAGAVPVELLAARLGAVQGAADHVLDATAGGPLPTACGRPTARSANSSSWPARSLANRMRCSASMATTPSTMPLRMARSCWRSSSSWAMRRPAVAHVVEGAGQGRPISSRAVREDRGPGSPAAMRAVRGVGQRAQRPASAARQAQRRRRQEHPADAGRRPARASARSSTAAPCTRGTRRSPGRAAAARPAAGRRTGWSRRQNIV